MVVACGFLGLAMSLGVKESSALDFLGLASRGPFRRFYRDCQGLVFKGLLYRFYRVC